MSEAFINLAVLILTVSEEDLTVLENIIEERSDSDAEATGNLEG